MFLLRFPPNVTLVSNSFPLSVFLMLTNIIEVVKNKKSYFLNALCSFEFLQLLQLMKWKLNERRKNDFRNSVKVRLVL